MKPSMIKEMAKSLGACLCGIAPSGRFSHAPVGFRPTDIYKNCRAVIVFAKRIPAETLFAESCVPYTHVNVLATLEVDRIASEMSLHLQDKGIGAVPVPSDDPYEHWQAERAYGRAILSLRHAGYLAGLGVLGKNSLLVNKRHGNMIQLGAVLVNANLEGDPVDASEACPPSCRLCLDSCPAKALDGTTVNQQLCRPLSNCVTEKGYTLKKCNLCRSVCPNSLGICHDRIS